MRRTQKRIELLKGTWLARTKLQLQRPLLNDGVLGLDFQSSRQSDQREIEPFTVTKLSQRQVSRMFDQYSWLTPQRVTHNQERGPELRG